MRNCQCASSWAEMNIYRFLVQMNHLAWINVVQTSGGPDFRIFHLMHPEESCFLVSLKE